MLLEDAKSEEEVEEVLAGARGQEEADELREDIEDKLQDVVRWYQWHGGEACEYEQFDIADAIMDNEKFLVSMIEQSPAEYNLRLVDHDTLQSRINEAAAAAATRHRHHRHGGLFDWGYGRLDRPNTYGFTFRMPSQISCFVSDHHFPENYEFIPSEFAEQFWDDLKSKLGVHDWAESTDRLHDNTGWADGEDITIGIGENKFAEWCRDIISEHIDEIAQKNPNEVRAMFRAALREEDPALAQRFFAAQPNDEDVLDLAVKWFSGDRSDVQDEIGGWLDAVEGGTEGESIELADREAVAEVTEDDLRKLGITTGTFWENRPWKLIKLEPQDLAHEGTAMRHCVGTKGMGYIRAVRDGEIEIWSLRSKDNKPRFTLEVDRSFYRAESDTEAEEARAGRKMTYFTAERQRGEAIKQLKGKANREAGYADAKKRDGLKFPEEVTVWAWIFDQLGVDASAVRDFSAFRSIVQSADPQPPRPNTGEACVGFDMPYRPLRRR